MKQSFFKFHGAGNDFILIDNRNSRTFSTELIKHLCHRRLGVGADGFITLSNSQNADFSMHYYNADGNLASLCGNGSRCIVAFANYLNIIDKTAHFEAFDGIHAATILEHNLNHWIVKIKMLDTSLSAIFFDGFLLDTGSPHFVQFHDNLENLNVFEMGRKLRYDNRFPNGVNVDFVKEDHHQLFVRTYERGVEDETLSCGTGVTASAIAYACKKNLPNGSHTIDINTLGGDFKVGFQKTDTQFTDITLTGPVIFSFCGTFDTQD